MPNYLGFSTYNRIRKYRLTDFDLIKQDLFNHFHIRRGEKLMNPNFGTIIWDALYEPFTDSLKQAINDDVRAVANYDPRLSIENVTITEFTNGIMIEVAVRYIPTNELGNLIMKFDREARRLTSE